MKYILISIALLSFGFNNNPISNKKQPTIEYSLKKILKTSFWVNGICEMCQKRIQKAALKTKGVKMANWNIKTKILSVVYNDKKCSVDNIKQNIASAGHDTIGFTATDEAYKNLHECCHYDRSDRP